jgi:hypothetical protein
MISMQDEPTPYGVTIPLRARDGSTRAYALVDEADADLAEHRWSLTGKGYVLRRKGHGFVYLHREISQRIGGEGPQVDHINGDRLDCRRSNLRPATRAENAQNVEQTGGTSRYRGVCFEQWSQRWRAQAQIGGRNFNLGRFDSEEEAAEAARAFRAVHMPYANEERHEH